MRISVISSAVLTLWFTALGITHAQQPITPKEVRVESSSDRWPVMIAKVTVSDQNVQCGLWIGPRAVQPVVPFEAGSDWLKNMTIYLYNRTRMPIVAADFAIGFPETGDGLVRPQVVYTSNLGRLPPSNAFTGNGKPIFQEGRTPLSWGRHQLLAIHLADHIDQIESLLQHTPNPAGISRASMVNKCIIHIGPFTFSDGSMWGGGGFLTPDPERPGRYKPMKADYWPGNPHGVWPMGPNPAPIP